MPRILVWLILLMASPSWGQGVYINGTDGAINGATTCTTPLTRDIAVADNFSVGDVELDVLATHSWRGDIDLTLVSPQGTRVQLITPDTGASGNIDNYNIRLTDSSTTRVNTPPHDTTDDVNAPAPQNIVLPDNALSAFDGQGSLGTWRVEVCDAFPTADNGTLLDLALRLTPVPPPPAPDLICPAGAPLQLAWTAPGGAYGWPAGSVATQSYAVSGFPIEVSLSGDTGVFIARGGTATPVTDNTVGGSGQFGLMSNADFANTSQSITYTFALGDPGIGFAGVQVQLFDVDLRDGAWQDSFAVTGSLGGSPVPLSLTPTGTTNYLDGNAIIGLSDVPTNGPGGEGTVTALQAVDTIMIVYSPGPRSPANPVGQVMAYSLIDFCPPANAELVAQKTAEVVGGGFALPGSDIRYVLSVSNPASSTARATDISIQDVLADNFRFVSATPSGFASGAFDPALPAANTDCAGGACVIGYTGAQLGVGETGEVEIIATLK